MAFGVLIAFAALWYLIFIAPLQKGPVSTGPFVLEGTIESVDAERLEIVITASSTGTRTVAKIAPETRVERIIVREDANGEVIERRGLGGGNLGDLEAGEAVTVVVYRAGQDSAAYTVEQVLSTVRGDVDAYLASAAERRAALSYTYVEGRVESVDLAERQIAYHPALFGQISTSTMSVAVPDDAQFFTVEDSSRAAIAHTRMPALFTDVRPGQTVFIQADAEALKDGDTVARAFIIIASKP